jgi:NADH:ubiquinone reductase (H+-translocating)
MPYSLRPTSDPPPIEVFCGPQVFGLKFSGFIAWLMWRGLYLLRIPTLARKTRLFLEWNWAMFFPPDIAHLGYRRTQRHGAQALSSTQPSAPATNPVSNG